MTELRPIMMALTLQNATGYVKERLAGQGCS